MKLIARMSEARQRMLEQRLPGVEIAVAGSSVNLFELAGPKTLAVVDDAGIAELTAEPPCPLLVVTDETLQGVVGRLAGSPWLAHVISATALQSPLATEHLTKLCGMVEDPSEAGPRLLDWVDDSVVGRRVRLVQASRRSERLDKLTEFYESNGVTQRTIQVLRDAAEELLTNAFYDAPVAAGVVGEAISRTRDVCLPDEHACDLAYGCQDDLAFVRVRDPFGSLTRTRLVDVLSRCARSDMQVQVDETMGGAGLGLWRIFSGATVVAISVVAGRSTEIFVAMWKRTGTGPRPSCVHLFFREGRKGSRVWKLDRDTTVTTAVTLVSK